jgi:hypothetical protein
MTLQSPIIGVLVLFSLLLAGIRVVAESRGWSSAGEGPFSIRAIPDDALAHEEEVGRALDEDRQELLRRNAAKRALVAELVAERMTLEEATGAFLAVDEGLSSPRADLQSVFPGRSDRERAARNVMAWALCGEGHREGVVTRLTTEFQKMFPAHDRPHPMVPGL